MTSLSPTSGPALGGTLVEVAGANLTRLGSLRVCRFGRALWTRDHGTLSVLTPRDGLRAEHGVAARAAHGLAPNEVFATIVNGSHARCVTPPSVQGPHVAVPLELALNGHDFTADAHAFTYYADATTLEWVFPISDSSAGGRALQLTGAGLTNGSDARCRFRAPLFGVVETAALALSPTSLACPSPAMPEGAVAAAKSRVTGAVSSALELVLDVTLNGQQYSLAPTLGDAGLPSTLAFAVIAGEEPTPRLLGVSPALGPANGSSLVLIGGLTMQFGSLYLCRFGEAGAPETRGAPDHGPAIVPGSYHAPSGTLRCLTPPHAPSAVMLAISLNGEHWENATFEYTFYAEPQLLGLSPASGPAFGMQCTDYACGGGASTGTLVTLSGVGLLAGGAVAGGGVAGGGGRWSSLARCRFNATAVPATIVDDATARCYSPGGVSAGVVALRLTLNDQDDSLASLLFSYATHTTSA